MLKRVVGSGAILAAKSVVLKFLGMLSTLVLARVLAPEDFGLIALALLAIGFLEVVIHTGTHLYLIRVETIDDDLVNSAWTLDILLRWGAALALFVIAPFIGKAYEEPQLSPLLWAFAALMAVAPLSNPGGYLLQREQRFKEQAYLDICAKVVSAISAVTLALKGAEHWALLGGMAVNTLVAVFGSYLIHPFRPKLCTKRIREQLSFSGWLIPQALLGYSRSNLDTFLVSANFGGAQLGSFHTMKYLAYIPSSSILQPFTQPLLRELSQSRGNPDYFALQHNVTLIASACIALPIATLMATCSHVVVEVFLGAKWIQYSELFGAFAFLIPAYLFFHHATRTCIVFGHTKNTLLYEIFALFFVFAPVVLFGIEDIIAFTHLRVGLEVVASFIFLSITALRYTNTKTYGRLIIGCTPIVLACAVATLASTSIAEVESPLLELILRCAIWSFAFGVTLFGLVHFFWRRQREWSYLLDKASLAAGALMQLLRK